MYNEIIIKHDCNLLQLIIIATFEWSKENKLNFNVSKCCIISFTCNKNYIIYKMNDETLRKAKNVKDWGVTFDSKLSAYKILGFVIR